MQRSLFFTVMLTSIYEVIFYRKSYLLFQKKCFEKKNETEFLWINGRLGGLFQRYEVKSDLTPWN